MIRPHSNKQLLPNLILFATLTVVGLAGLRDLFSQEEISTGESSIGDSTQGPSITSQIVNFDAIAPPETARDIQFLAVEESIRKVPVSEGELVKGPALSAALRSATGSYIDTEIPPQSLDRIQFLIQKSLPGEPGRQFAALFERFLPYRRAEETLLSETNGELTLQQEITRHEKRVELQHRYLGKSLTNALFGQQHRLASYMFERRRLQTNEELSESQRQEKLQKLQQAFQQSMQEMP